MDSFSTRVPTDPTGRRKFISDTLKITGGAVFLATPGISLAGNSFSGKKEYTLRKHWLVHTKTVCERDGNKIVKEYLGKTNRRTFFCNTCQVQYD